MITNLLERLIHAGKARFETYQTGLANFSYIPILEGEYIVVTGFTFQPPFIANYENPDASIVTRANICKLEFFDGLRYNHFIFKNDGQSVGTATPTPAAKRNNLFNVPGLYLVFKNNIGLKVSFPKNEAHLFSAVADLQNQLLPALDSQISVKPFESVINTPATLLSNPWYPLGPAYSDFWNPPIPAGGKAYQGTPQLNFDGAGNVRQYSTNAVPENYLAGAQNDMANSYYLNVQYVRVQEPPDLIS